MKRFIVIAFLLLSNTVFSQQIVDDYNQWLNQRELSDYLVAEQVSSEKQGADNFQILELRFNTQSKDTAIAYWTRLNELYTTKGNTTFPELLFYNYLRLVRSKRPDTLVIKLTDREFCTTTFVYYDEDTRQIVDTTSYCLAKIIEISGLPVKRTKETIENINANRAEVFKQIFAFSKDFYKKQGGIHKKYNKSPVRIQNYSKSDDSLIFRVQGLKQEILPDYGDEFTCWLLSFFMDQESCYPWEYLRFIIGFEQENAAGKLHIRIEGRVCDGTSSRPVSWSKARDMEPQFNDALEDYTALFRQQLRNELFNRE